MRWVFLIRLLNTTNFLGPPSRIDPSQVTVSGKTDSSIAFAWTAPYDGNSPILNYTISYKLNGSSNDYTVYRVVDVGIKTATLSRLKAFTNYAIRIVASNVEGPAEGTTTPKIIRTETGSLYPSLELPC